MSRPQPSAQAAHVLVVDDEESMRHSVRRAMERAGYAVRAVEDGNQALEALREQPADVVVTDIRMPNLNGHELFERIAAVDPFTRTVLMTGHGTIADAVRAMQAGAESYLAKPFEREELLVAVERAVEKAALLRANSDLRARLARGPGIVGQSAPIKRLLKVIAQVAPRDGVALIHGESGSGKELVARAIHAASSRADGPFVTLHCGAFPEGLLETELFGVEEGAFTGAETSRPGYAERADGGTLFLDEVGEMPLSAQVSLLRLLQEGEVVRIGGTEVRHPDVRVLAATQKDLRTETAAGRFRDDLFYRLNVLPVTVPSLRERRDDIPSLCGRFFADFGRPDLELSEDAVNALAAWSWPGNVRELRNLAERLSCTAEGSEITRTELPPDILGEESVPAVLRPYRQALEDFERSYLEDLLRKAKGNVSEASRLGGVPRPTLHSRLRALRVDASSFRSG